MKIYLILNYQQKEGAVWAEVQAFTSPKLRAKAMEAFAGTNADVETQDIEIAKRAYSFKVQEQITVT